jgi:hypothetical protein
VETTSAAGQSPQWARADELRAMVTGFRLSAAPSVAADLGLSDQLGEGPRTVPELAASVSADEDSLRRLLHARATVGVYEERDVWAYRESHPESNAVFNDT